ncbi:uncharacterized protein [Haliotis cracherodii]|uniref:uncharacterized protein n=1 Tax=Haliotis cracherodii TaxID=6455 RepID=UPI0039E8BD6D
MNKLKMAVEESPRASRSRNRESCVPALPPLSINTMTQGQLREFVPALMKVVSGSGECTRGPGLIQRPHWWPPDVPLWSNATDRNKEAAFTEAMKKVVRSCYHHLGQESLLSTGKLNDWKTVIAHGQSRRQNFNANNSSDLLCRTPDLMKSGKKPFVEIYVCFFCNKEFSNKEEMRKHQLNCTERPQELQALNTPPPATKRNKFKVKSPTSSPTTVTPPRSPTLENYLQKLHLIPVSKAKKLRASTRKSTDLDCAKIDFSEPETPVSPTTPKTPKLLISQLSRDDSGQCKRRLSYRIQEEHSDSESVVSGSSEDTEEKQAPVRTKSLLNIELSSLLGQRIQKHLKSESNICVVANAEAFCKTPVKNHFLEKLRKKENVYPVTYKPRKKFKKRPHVHMYCFTKRQRQLQFKKLETGLDRKSRLLARSLPKCKVVIGRLSKQGLKYWLGRKETQQKKTQCIFPEGPTFLSEDIDKMLGLRKKNKPPKPERSLSLANVVSEDTNAEVLQQKVAVYRSLLSDLSSSKEQTLISMSPSKQSSQKTLKGSNLQAAEKKYNKLSASLFTDDFMENPKLKERFPQLNSLLAAPSLPGEPLTPSSSTSSSPVSSRQLFKKTFSQPLKIDIPSQGSLGKQRMISPFFPNSSHGDGLREHISPDDSVSIITVSSDEDSFTNSLCCTGCRQRQKCKCTPVKIDLSKGVKPPHNVEVSPIRNYLGQFLKKDVKPKAAHLPGALKKTKDRKECNVSLEEKKVKETSTEHKNKQKTSVGGKLKNKKTDEMRSKEPSLLADVKESRKRVMVSECKKRTDASVTIGGQYGLRKQASSTEGIIKFSLRSSPVNKINLIKKPTKLGLRSHNSAPANYLGKGLKRHASDAPTKSANISSPKKSKLDVLPRTRRNSVLV